MKETEVLLVQRKPRGVQISVERQMAEIRKNLPADIAAELHVSPQVSNGIFPRWANFKALKSVVRNQVVHITGDVLYLAPAIPPEKLMITVLDCAVLYKVKGIKRAILRKMWYEWPIRRAAVVTTTSKATIEDLHNWIPHHLISKICVIPNCVNTEFQPTHKEFRKESPRFLQIGTAYNKNLERIAVALNGIPCILDIVGPLTESQLTLLKENRINYVAHGKVTDEQLVAIYHNIDALLFVSTIEGFGLPIIEAQATGRAVVTSNKSSMPEVAGKGALLVDPENIESIKTGIQRLISDRNLQAKLVQDGFENVKRYQASTIARQYAQLYRDLNHIK